MSSRYRDIPKAVALLTVFCVMQVYVFAGATPSPAVTELRTNPSPQAAGTLKTTNNQPVVVNGNSVRPGTTILSGATIETPAGVAATVQWSFGTLEIFPVSDLTVEFTADGDVKVTLKRGCAILRTFGSASGVIITPDGKTTETGKDHKADVCYPDRGGIGAAAGAGGIDHSLLAVLIAGGAAGAIAAILLAGGGANPSPSSP